MEIKKDDKKRVKSYVKFSGIAIQMGVVIAISALGGNWLDEKQENEFPIWTLVLTLLSIFGSLYQIIREVIKMNEDEDNSKG